MFTCITLLAFKITFENYNIEVFIKYTSLNSFIVNHILIGFLLKKNYINRIKLN